MLFMGPATKCRPSAALPWLFVASLSIILVSSSGGGGLIVVGAAAADEQQPRLKSDDLFNLNSNNNNNNNSSNRAASANGCGYASCPPIDPNKLNVHIVAHTHDDVGWLKTVDQYYYGTRKQYSPVGVEHILDSIVPQLVMDESKRFIYVEMSFFAKWWRDQDEQIRGLVRRLVNEGRLEFINGGWCMNDEATVTYYSTIEQMTLGLKFLNETFGACGRPKVGWQIDPFGHTNEQASLFAQFGFDGMFFTRISYEDKEERTENKTLDLIWHGDRALSGQSGSIFTNIFRDGYDAPRGFCFDAFCQDDLLVDNKNSYEYNIDQKGKDFIAYIKKYAEAKMTNQLLIPLGGDFQYTAAGQNFKNSDKLIKYVRSVAPDLNIFYSTPSCYQYAVHQTARDHELKLPEKYDDFMPYDSTPSVWWSGYFTSRPSVKLVTRETANLLQVARFVSLADLLSRPQQTSGEERWPESVHSHESRCLEPLWEILGDLQHHDAVTGTEKQHVADDYVRRASDAANLCAKFIGELRRSKLVDENLRRSAKYVALSRQQSESGKRYKSLDPVFLEGTQLCHLLNISQCDAMEAEVDFKRYELVGSAALKLLAGSKPELQEGQLGGVDGGRVKRSMAAAPGGTPNELLTRAVLLNIYNPLARPIDQHDIRLPCNGRCDLDKVRVIHLATNETIKLIRLALPSGVGTLPFRKALTNYEILFYANISALGYTSFVIEDTNNEEIVDEETDPTDSLVITDENADPNKTRPPSVTVRSRRLRRQQPLPPTPISDDEIEIDNHDYTQQGLFKYDYFTMDLNPSQESATSFGNYGANPSDERFRRESSLSKQSIAERVIVKFDLSSGMIVGLKRASDGSFLNISQKFGYYYPTSWGPPAGAYIFRPNSSEPVLLDKPIVYKMFKRKSGALIEIHQKWADWLWQTIRVDAKKNYIEFDYVVGPIPVQEMRGREVVTRYITNLPNNGVFLTDSNGRQLMARRRLRSQAPEQTGGSFYPVVSTIMLRSATNATNAKCSQKCTAEAVAVLVDRAQAGTSLNEGQLELLIHRRHMKDDNWGVGEALDEPGDDGRGLVTRGRHRLYLKFPDQPQPPPSSQYQHDANGMANKSLPHKKQKPQLFKLPNTPRANLDYEQNFYSNGYAQRGKASVTTTSTYIVHDTVYNDLKEESRKIAMKPILTFDRLRVPASEFVDMIAADAGSRVKADFTLLNTSLPNNVHLLTLQPWASGANEVLIRLENLNNPLTLHPFPDYEAYQSLVRSYKAASDSHEVEEGDTCTEKLRPRVEANIEYLLKGIRIVEVEELSLGANARLKDEQRLDWTNEGSVDEICDPTPKPTSIKLAPRQIRTFLARFDFL